MSITRTVDLGILGEEVEVVIEYDYTPGTPGKLTGPWEDSYPAEPSEITITSVTCQLLSQEGLNSLASILQDDDNLLVLIDELEADSADDNRADFCRDDDWRDAA